MKIHSKIMPLTELIDLLIVMYKADVNPDPIIRVEAHVVGNRKIIKLTASVPKDTEEVLDNGNL